MEDATRDANIIRFPGPSAPSSEEALDATTGALESTSIRWVHYDPDCEDLYVCFRDSGDAYIYHGVGVETYELFMASESKGRFLNQIIRPHHEVQKLG